MLLDEVTVTVNPEDISVVVEKVPNTEFIIDPDPEIIVVAGNNIGQTGPVGPTGIQGIPGPVGPQGVEGPLGPTGPQGSTGTGILMKGEVATQANLPSTGNAQGDAYIVQADDSLWIYDGTTFVSGGSIQGPPGAQGIQGAQGPTGAQGTQGPQGVKGDTGADSTVPGPQGIQGVKGDTGSQGPTGADSTVPGPQGVQGVKGDKGDQGDVGPASTVPGPPGSQGVQGPQGVKGDTGSQGPAGLGVPPGGAAGTVLTKQSPADNDTTWVPASGGSDLVYEGSHVPATAHQDGDIVIKDGMAYIAVRPTNAAPDPLPWNAVGLSGSPGPPGPPGVVTAFREGHTFAVAGDLSLLPATLPSIFVPMSATQTTILRGVRAKIASGTSVGVQVKRNGSNVGGVITVSPTVAETSLGNIALANNDELTPVLSALIGTPTTLSLTLILETTAT